MRKTILILIFIVALFLRLYKLGEFPVGFLWDEAALGYNSYSILKTAKDEYGQFLPLIFKSFGDCKPGLYVYLALPFVAIFGLNEFSIRLPSAVFGAVTVIILYFLIKEAYKLMILKEPSNSERIALISAFLLAINPWHLNFSRGAWELNIMLTEILFGLFLLLRFLNSKKSYNLYFGIIIFLSTVITYQSAKLLMPGILIAFIFFFRQKIKKVSFRDQRNFFLIMLFGFILFNMFTFLTGKAGRIKVMSVFSYPRSTEETNMILNQDKGNFLDFTIFHSSPAFFTRSVLGRYFNHFSAKYLFFSGDWSNPRNGTVYQGQMYLLDGFFMLLGIAALFIQERNPLNSFMIFWLLIAPLSSALTRDSVSAVRSFSMVIPLIYLSANGVNLLTEWLKRQKNFFRILAYVTIGGFYLILFVRFLDLYFIHDSKFSSKDRLYGYKEMVLYVNDAVSSKDRAIITNKYGQPYIFYLFYTRYDPKKYQEIAFLKENPYGDVGEVEKIDNLEFRKIYFPNERGTKNSLIVGDEFELPIADIVGQENITFVKEIKFLNDKTAFRIVETR